MANSSFPISLLRLQVEGTELTKGERENLRLLGMGFTQIQIAERRGRSYETIRKQMKIARARLGARTNCHAVAIALSLELI